MPKLNNSKNQITKIQQIIKQYTITTKSNDQVEKRSYINNLVNNYKLNRKDKQYINRWINNNIFQQSEQQQQTRFQITKNKNKNKWKKNKIKKN